MLNRYFPHSYFKLDHLDIIIIVTLNLDSLGTIGLVVFAIASYSVCIFQLGRKYQHKNPQKIPRWMQ